MLIIVAVAIAIFVLTYVCATDRNRAFAELSERRTAMATIGIQIVCADCSGERQAPIKTSLSRSGSCDHCGGHSFILASDTAMLALRTRIADSPSRGTLPEGRRVLHFEPRISRPSMTGQIAIKQQPLTAPEIRQTYGI